MPDHIKQKNTNLYNRTIQRRYYILQGCTKSSQKNLWIIPFLLENSRNKSTLPSSDLEIDFLFDAGAETNIIIRDTWK